MVTYIFRIYGRNKVPCCSFPFSILHFTRLREKQRFQEDKSSNCVDYPTERFATYADCDIDFVRRNLPEGLAPFWAVDNVSLASNNWDKIKVNQSVIETLDWATQGLSYPFHSIFLSVPSTVLTTAIKEDSFELMESLNYLARLKPGTMAWPGTFSTV